MAKMKLNFKKIDLTWIKQFLLARGEKLVLGIVLSVGMLMVGSGLMGAMSANGKALAQKLREETNQINRAIVTDDPSKFVPPMQAPKTRWDSRYGEFPFCQYVPVTELTPPKRSNPTVMPILAGAENVKFDFIKGAAVQVYAVERNIEKVEVLASKSAGAKEKTPDSKQFQIVETLVPKRMLVVSCYFPIQEQLQEFQNALRLDKKDLKDDYPKILGVNIYRIDKVMELDPKTNEMVEKVKEEIPLYLTGKFEDNKYGPNNFVAPHLDNLLRDAHIDEDALKPFALHQVSGLMTLMPKLANTTYPPLILKNFQEVAEPKDPKEIKKNPKEFPDKGMKGFDKTNKGDVQFKKPGREGNLIKIPWTDLEPAADNIDPQPVAQPPMGKQFPGGGAPEAKFVSLVKRWRGTYPVFDTQEAAAGPGVAAGKDPARKQFPVKGPPMKPPGKDPMKDPGKDPPPAGGKVEEVASLNPLIRFFDVDLEPGHTYEYKIQVRMKNPNFNKKDDVTISTDADIEELPPSEWRTTPPFTVPANLNEVAYYAVDQWERKPAHPCGPDFAELDEKTQKVPMQVQRWFGETVVAGDKYVITDWVVAERVLVRRGEYIGRRDLSVPAATWSKQKDDFEVPNPPKLATEDKDKKKVIPPAPAGLRLDFAVTDALLVDFEGGPKPIKKPSGFNPRVDLEDSVMDVLVLQPDGKLTVHNAHRDFNSKARQEVEKSYHERIEQFIVRPTDDQPGVDPKAPPKEKKIFGGS